MPATSAVDPRRARLTDAAQGVAKIHGALAVVVSQDKIVDEGVHEHTAAGRRQGERYGDRHAHPLMSRHASI
jgi:hypothetical protein